MMQVTDTPTAVLARTTSTPQSASLSEVVAEPSSTVMSATSVEVQRLMTWVPQMVQALESSRQQFVSWHDTMAKMLVSPQEVQPASVSSSAYCTRIPVPRFRVHLSCSRYRVGDGALPPLAAGRQRFAAHVWRYAAASAHPQPRFCPSDL